MIPEGLQQAPRFPLGHLPTPLEPLDRLRTQLDVRPKLWIKRDNCTGLATGGNKTRKLEYLIGAALEEGATCIMTTGALQSNHARQTAAAAARAGLDSELILTRAVQWTGGDLSSGGNLLLDDLLGATVTICEPKAFREVRRARLAELTAAGQRVYDIPAGGSNAIGALGYVRAGIELVEQCQALGFDPDLIAHASSSGGTQAGLIVGVLTADSRAEVLGFNTWSLDFEAHRKLITNLVTGTAALAGVAADQAPVSLDNTAIGDGYGMPTEAMRSAVHLLARTEGILLDPVYSGKAFAGFLSRLRSGDFDAYENVVFVHTGGAASLGVYANVLQ